MGRIVGVNAAADVLGVSISTLRRLGRCWPRCRKVTRLTGRKRTRPCSSGFVAAAGPCREEAGAERHWRALRSLAQLCAGFTDSERGSMVRSCGAYLSRQSVRPGTAYTSANGPISLKWLDGSDAGVQISIAERLFDQFDIEVFKSRPGRTDMSPGRRRLWGAPHFQ